MSAFLKKLDAHLPFNKTERIIIGIVILLHALPALEFLHFSQRPPQMDDARVMANLLSPEAANKSQQPTPATPPKPKEEKKVEKEKPKEKPTDKPSPTQAQPPTPSSQAQKK